MESPRKNNDCYFYYYSTCLKGDGCMFRHEPSALGCETVCSFWQQGKCLNQHCNFRHMELRKNRKMIPCYWENQPGGCRKPHCSFQHKNPREPIGGDLEKAKDCENVGAGKPLDRPEWPRRTVLAEGAQFDECVGSSDSDSGRVGPRRVSQSSEASYGSPPVDPLVVNFEEESDNESVPTSTPTKKPQKNVHVKTLEEIRLERIQAESAAFYSYNVEITSNDLRSRILSRKTYHKPAQDFKILSLDEIRKSRVVVESSDEGSPDASACVSSQQGVSKPHLNVDTENNNSVNSGVEISKEISDSTENCNVNNLNAICMKHEEHVESKHARKRSHSPIIFDTSPMKLPRNIITNEELRNNLATTKECDNKMRTDVGLKRKCNVLPQPSKRVRKLVRGVQQIDQTNARQLRLKRGINVANNCNVVHMNSESLLNSEVSLEVPTENVNGQFQKLPNLSGVQPSDPLSLNANASEGKECEMSSSEIERISDSFEGGVDQELSSDLAVNSSPTNHLTSNRCSIDSDELYLDGQDNSMTLEADENILQDIDELLND